MKLRPAYPYFGSKASIAPELWDAFGVDTANFVDPFCGSASVLLARPMPGKIETVNDLHCFIPCFLRAVRSDPEAVATHAAWPVSEVDMHARHRALLERVDEAFVERMRADADFFDAQVAGWWVWGASIWIGSGWCDASRLERDKGQRVALIGRGGQNGNGKPKEGCGIFRGSISKKPRLHGREASAQQGVGIFRDGLNTRRKSGQVPSLSGSDGSGVGYGRGIFASGRREDLLGYFRALAERLALVRITCGDWSRVVTPAVTISHGLTAVLLDPPYGAKRTKNIYAHDSMTISADVRAWALEHGDNPLYRIALCGYEGEHEMPSSWRKLAWKANGGYGNRDGANENAAKERVWFSPFCLGGELAAGPLFEVRA